MLRTFKMFLPSRNTSEDKKLIVEGHQENIEVPPPPYSAAILLPVSDRKPVFHMDKDVVSFLARLSLSDLIGIFEKEELVMEDVMKLSNEDLKDIGVDRLKHRKLIKEEIERMKTHLSVVISSTGKAALRQRGMLGQYEYDGDNGYYVQTSTEGDSEHYTPVYLYPDEDDKWWVGPSPDRKAGWLHNPTKSKTLPKFQSDNDWLCWDDTAKTWLLDPSLNIIPGPLSFLSMKYIVTGLGDVARRWPSALGVFTRTQRWWNGRPVFENSKGWFLHHGAGVGWMIGSRIGKHELMGSTWSHHSPAGENNWKYFDFDASNFKPASISILAAQ